MVQETEQIGIESVINDLFDRLGYIAEVYVTHLPSASEVAQLHITVHTGDAESFEEYLDLTPADELMIDTGEADPLTLPYDMITTVDGPGHMQGTEGTTVYMADDVMGADPRELEDGLRVLRQKLAGVCPSCEAEVDTFADHYGDSLECQQAERV